MRKATLTHNPERESCENSRESTLGATKWDKMDQGLNPTLRFVVSGVAQIQEGLQRRNFGAGLHLFFPHLCGPGVDVWWREPGRCKDICG